MELTLDLSQFTHEQRVELLALVESFAIPRYIPSADEQYPPAKIDKEGRAWSCHTNGDKLSFPCVFPLCNDEGSGKPCTVVTPNTICSCHE